MRKRRVTLQTVADLACVNRVTAAVALGRSPQGGTRVSEATRLRVLAAARELNYAPNVIAQVLRGERTHMIGYYAGYEALDAHSPFTAAILQGLQHGCRVFHQDLLLFGSFARDTVDSVFATLASGKIDGLVLLPTPRSPLMDQLFDSHLPVVVVVNAHPAAPSVVVDDVRGAQLLVEYLAQKGHRHLLYRTSAEVRTSTVRRRQAFETAAWGAGCQVTVTIESANHALTEQEIAVLTAPSAQRPTAAICWMDLSAYTLLAACDRLGLRVPDDLAITGFDGVPLNIPPARRLTTVQAPWADVAAKAVEYLLRLLDGGEVPQETCLPVTLLIGDTA